MKLDFSQWIFKKYITQTSWKSIQRDLSCYTWMDGQTDTKKLTVAFSKFVNANNNSAVAGIYIVTCVTAWNMNNFKCDP